MVARNLGLGGYSPRAAPGACRRESHADSHPCPGALSCQTGASDAQGTGMRFAVMGISYMQGGIQMNRSLIYV